MILLGESSILEAGMTVALHPSIVTSESNRVVAVANTYHLQGKKAVPLSSLPSRVHEI